MKIQENALLNIKAVAFDMDGLIFDTERLSRDSFFDTAAKMNVAVDEDFYPTLIGVHASKSDNLILQQFGNDFDIKTFNKKWMQKRAELAHKGGDFKAGFAELFDALVSKGLPISLVTSSPYEDVVFNFAKQGDYLQQFHTTLAQDCGLPSKPAPDKYIHAAQAMGVAVEHLLVLEDSNIGMQSAINAKAIAIMVPDLLPPDAYSEKHAYAILPSLHAVKEKLALS